MHKSELLMNLILGVILSLVLSLFGSMRGGHFVVNTWLFSLAISFFVSQLIGLLVPYKRLIDGVCKIIHTARNSIKGILVSAVLINLLYTPIMSGSMSVLMSWFLSKMNPMYVRPPIVPMLIGSIASSLLVAYIVIILTLPVIYGIFKKYPGLEGDGVKSAGGRIIYVTIVLIVVSFLTSTLLAVFSIEKIITTENRHMAELLAQNVCDEIHIELDNHVSVGQIVANDGVLEAILEKEKSYSDEELEEAIQKELLRFKNRFACNTVFLVSEASHRYYTQDGLNKTIAPENDSHDVWYSTFLSLGKNYDFDIDVDEAHDFTWTIFVNVRVEDEKGNLLGVCGIGTQMADIQQFILKTQEKYDVVIGIVDESGNVQLNGENVNIEQAKRGWDIQALTENLDSDGERDNYVETGSGYLFSRTIPALGWQLIVQRNIDSFGILLNTLAQNIFVMIIIFIIFLFIATFLLRKTSGIMARNIQLSSYETLRNMYDGVYLFDLNTHLVSEIKNFLPGGEHLFDVSSDFISQMDAVIEKWVDESSQGDVAKLFELESLDARFRNRSSRFIQFIANEIGWCRGCLIVVREPKKQNIDHMIFAIEIIEEEVRKQSELRQESEAARAASEAKGRFLANMSHEIRTPINAVLGMDTMILRESTEPQIKEYAMNIHDAGNTLLSLINDILDFSKIESGKMDIVPVEYELASLINDVSNMIRVKAEAKSLKLNVKVDASLPSSLYGDDIRIRQVILNIMNNAVKYTQTGSVSLEVTGTKTDKEAILHFSVKDTGIGIKEEDMGKLFSDFERIEESRNRSIEGTGLGMSITVQLLKLMGSKLEVASQYGQGSEFSFDLKQEIRNAEPIGDFTRHSLDKAKGYEYDVLFTAPDAKALIIDDNKLNRFVFAGLLKKTKMKIDQAGGGHEGLEKLQQEKYDIVFLDHMMPDMDGMEVMAELKKKIDAGEEVVNATTPVIALTANAISGAREQYVAAGFTDYLSKPIDAEKLERMIAKLIPEEKKVREE